MQLEFLGEAFDPADCRRMCDNCRRGGGGYEAVDMTKNVLTLIRCVEDCGGKITSSQLGDLMRGRQVTSVFLRKDVTAKHKGLLKHVSEGDVRRLIIKSLIMGVLEEVFETFNRGGGSNIVVYTQIGPRAGFIVGGRLTVGLSKAVAKRDDEFSDNEEV